MSKIVQEQGSWSFFNAGCHKEFQQGSIPKSFINLSGYWLLQFTLSGFLTETPPLPGTLPSLLA